MNQSGFKSIIQLMNHIDQLSFDSLAFRFSSFSKFVSEQRQMQLILLLSNKKEAYEFDFAKKRIPPF